MSGETFLLLYNMENTRTAKKLKTRSTLHASFGDACTSLSSHLSLLCVESKIKLKITTKAIRPHTQSEIHTERNEYALTCSEVTQWKLAFHFSLRWRTRPCPLQFLFLSRVFQRSYGILHMRLPQRLPTVALLTICRSRLQSWCTSPFVFGSLSIQKAIAFELLPRFRTLTALQQTCSTIFPLLTFRAFEDGLADGVPVLVHEMWARSTVSNFRGIDEGSQFTSFTFARRQLYCPAKPRLWKVFFVELGLENGE